MKCDCCDFRSDEPGFMHVCPECEHVECPECHEPEAPCRCHREEREAYLDERFYPGDEVVEDLIGAFS